MTSKNRSFGKENLTTEDRGKADELADLLNRLNEGDDAILLKKEVKEFLSRIDQKGLAIAEQKLVEGGLEEGDMRNLCAAHMEMVRGELKSMKVKLKPGHVLHTLVEEHKIILSHLDSLEKLNGKIQGTKNHNIEGEEIEKLFYIADQLLEVEPHTRREEEVIFSELERRGIYGTPNILKTEHNELKGWKAKFKETVANGEWADFGRFQKDLKLITEVLTIKLRDHIFKEDNILFPTALQVIPKDRWPELKRKCDEIGYEGLLKNK